MAKKLMKGCEAIGEAAIQAGCRLFFGYPITPQNEIPEYLSVRLPQVGGTYVQAESEVAASHMLYGAAGAGCRCFTSSSGPGISLMQEGISYIAGAELPVVFVNIMRGGPGLGGILPSQGDYLQAVKGGGHGDYRCLVLAPSTVQEAADLVQDAFALADTYRNPVMVLGDGVLGQMMEPVEFTHTVRPEDLPPKPWATTGARGRKPNVINSLYLDPEVLEAHDRRLAAKYETMAEVECRHEAWRLDGELDVLFVAYGTVARICKTAIEALAGRGVRAGLFRPISLFPYPGLALAAAARRAAHVLVAELSCGQLLEDVRYHVGGASPVSFYGRQGGVVITPEELAETALRLAGRSA
jgi:2-oxoglutarate ferredoxin oxidoreductase subunit alpha